MEAVATRPGHRRTSTLVILDPGVADAAMLAAGVVEGAIAHILEAERDGVEQITELLQG